MEKVVKVEEFVVKGIKINVEQSYYYDEENGIYYDDIELGNDNLRRIRNAYRKEVGLLTDIEIKEIRNQYNLNQRNFSLLLGFGEVTITRYESKSIQEKAHDMIIRSVKEPNVFLDYVKKNKSSFLKYNSIESYNKLFEIINNKINNNLISSGNIEYDNEKFYSVIDYLLKHNVVLTKTKLAKYLWYIDFLFFKKYNYSITGLTYVHNHYGAYPIGFNEKISCNNIVIKEIYYEANDNFTYFIEKCESNVVLNKEETEIIDEIINKFKNYNTKELVDYMHNEVAYKNTKLNEIISYNYASGLSL